MGIKERIKELIERECKDLSWIYTRIVAKKIEEIEKYNKIVELVESVRDELEKLKKFFPLPKSRNAKTYDKIREELRKLTNGKGVYFYVQKWEHLGDFLIAVCDGYDLAIAKFDEKEKRLKFWEYEKYSEEKIIEEVRALVEFLKKIREAYNRTSFDFFKTNEVIDLIQASFYRD